MHIRLMDNDGGMDVCKLTLQEIIFIGTDAFAPAGLGATIKKLQAGTFGVLGWLEQRPFKDGATAFDDLLHGRSAAPRIVLRP